MSKEINFNIVKHIAVLSENKGWQKELNLISWNGGDDKYDIRSWRNDHEAMTRGITLNKEEMQILVESYSKSCK